MMPHTKALLSLTSHAHQNQTSKNHLLTNKPISPKQNKGNKHRETVLSKCQNLCHRETVLSKCHNLCGNSVPEYQRSCKDTFSFSMDHGWLLNFHLHNRGAYSSEQPLPNKEQSYAKNQLKSVLCREKCTEITLQVKYYLT